MRQETVNIRCELGMRGWATVGRRRGEGRRRANGEGRWSLLTREASDEGRSSTPYPQGAVKRRYCVGRLGRTLSVPNARLLVLAGKERKGIKARVDYFQGHQPPS